MYSIVDHRAPWIIPQNADPIGLDFLSDIWTVLSGITCTCVTISLMFTGGAWWWPVLIALFITVIPYKIFHKWVHKVPSTAGLDDYKIKQSLIRMKTLYKQYPDEYLSEILASAYPLIKNFNVKGISAREVLMQEYIKTIPTKSPVDLELDRFKNIIETRKEMMQEGLL